MADTLVPIRIQQIISKNPKAPVSSQDWNDILNMLIAQGNGLSDQLMALQDTIASTATTIINNLIAAGTLTLNVDATKLGGIVAANYALQTDLTNLSTAFANTYATVTQLNSAKSNIADLQSKITTTNTAPTSFVGEGKIVFVRGDS